LLPWDEGSTQVDLTIQWENPPTTVYFEVKYLADLSPRVTNGQAGFPSDQLIRNVRVGLPTNPFIGELAYGDLIRVLQRQRDWFTHPEKQVLDHLVEYLAFKMGQATLGSGYKPTIIPADSLHTSGPTVKMEGRNDG